MAEYRFHLSLFEIDALRAGRMREIRRPVRRRCIGPDRAYPAGTWSVAAHPGGGWRATTTTDPRAEFCLDCPFGTVSDRLWIAESWCPAKGLAFTLPRDVLLSEAGAAARPGIVYRADGTKLRRPLRWETPQVMPRWASRFTIQIAQVRVEPIQAISREGVIACGFVPTDDGQSIRVPCLENLANGPTVTAGPATAFELEWDLRYQKTPFAWDENPYAWVVGVTIVRAVA
mgnify:CR=1 FL=1